MFPVLRLRNVQYLELKNIHCPSAIGTTSSRSGHAPSFCLATDAKGLENIENSQSRPHEPPARPTAAACAPATRADAPVGVLKRIVKPGAWHRRHALYKGLNLIQASVRNLQVPRTIRNQAGSFHVH